MIRATGKNVSVLVLGRFGTMIKGQILTIGPNLIDSPFRKDDEILFKKKKYDGWRVSSRTFLLVNEDDIVAWAEPEERVLEVLPVEPEILSLPEEE